MPLVVWADEAISRRSWILYSQEEFNRVGSSCFRNQSWCCSPRGSRIRCLRRGDGSGISTVDAAVCSIELWEDIYGLFKNFSSLEEATTFLSSSYWMISDPAEACRKSLSILLGIHAELDPKKNSHFAFFFEFCCIFARSLVAVLTQIFNALFRSQQIKRILQRFCS